MGLTIAGQGFFEIIIFESHLRQTKPESLGAVNPRNLYSQSIWVFFMPLMPVLCNLLLQVKGLAESGFCHLIHSAPPGGSRERNGWEERAPSRQMLAGV